MKEMVKARLKALWRDEDGIGTLEMLLIIALIIVVAIAFRRWIMEWINRLLEDTNSNVGRTLNENTIEMP